MLLGASTRMEGPWAAGAAVPSVHTSDRAAINLNLTGKFKLKGTQADADPTHPSRPGKPAGAWSWRWHGSRSLADSDTQLRYRDRDVHARGGRSRPIIGQGPTGVVESVIPSHGLTTQPGALLTFGQAAVTAVLRFAHGRIYMPSV